MSRIPTDEEATELVTKLHMMLSTIFNLDAKFADEAVMIHPDGFEKGIVLDFSGTVAGTYWLLAPEIVTGMPGWQLLRQEIDHSTNAVGFVSADMDVHRDCVKMVADAIFQAYFKFFEMEQTSTPE